MLGVLAGGVGDGFALAGLDHADGGLDEVADHAFDVAADVADLGELGRLDLHERSADEAGETAGDLGLADAGRADHEDILGKHLSPDVLSQLPAAPAVTDGDGDGSLGGVLADDVAVQFGDDLTRGQLGHESSSTVRLVLV